MDIKQQKKSDKFKKKTSKDHLFAVEVLIKVNKFKQNVNNLEWIIF